MAENFYAILTDVGKAKFTNAGLLGSKVNITEFAVGDGNGTYYNPSEDQTALKNEVWRGSTSSISIDESNPNWIVIETVIPSSEGGFTIREAAVFNDTGAMIVIGKYPETYKPIISEGSTRDLRIKVIIVLSNTDTVSLKIDPTVILASKEDVNALAGTDRTTETVKGNADEIKKKVSKGCTWGDLSGT